VFFFIVFFARGEDLLGGLFLGERGGGGGGGVGGGGGEAYIRPVWAEREGTLGCVVFVSLKWNDLIF